MHRELGERGDATLVIPAELSHGDSAVQVELFMAKKLSPGVG